MLQHCYNSYNIATLLQKLTKMMHKCSYCDYKSNHKWVVTRHMNTTHAGTVPIEQNMYQTQDVNACIRQWQAAYQNVNAKNKQLETQINQYSSQSSKAPTTISIGPNHPKAPTTVSVPPLRSNMEMVLEWIWIMNL